MAKRKQSSAAAAKAPKKPRPSSKKAPANAKSSGKASGKGRSFDKKAKKVPAPVKPVEEDDGEVDDEDIEFFEGNAAFSSFLMKMDPKALR